MNRTATGTASVQRCRYCGSPRLFTVRCEYPSPHFARTGCRDCGRHLRIKYAPMTQERAEGFTLTFGKYRGRRVGEVHQADPAYLRWMAENLGSAAGDVATYYLDNGVGKP